MVKGTHPSVYESNSQVFARRSYEVIAIGTAWMSDEPHVMSVSFADVVGKRQIAIRRKTDWRQRLKPSPFCLPEHMRSLPHENAFQLCGFCGVAISSQVSLI